MNSETAISSSSQQVLMGVGYEETARRSFDVNWATWTSGVATRFMDIVLSLAAIVLVLPLMAVIALAVKLTSCGPVFFLQERAGYLGVPFKMIKFRSMVVDAEERLSDLIRIEELKEPVYKIKDDPRVTPVGEFLRRFGLDELPQFVNVLRGEMSIVGPRPEAVALARRYNSRERQRLLAKPGITGYQQIHNRGTSDMAAKLEYDLHYLQNRGLILDIRIMLRTTLVMACGKEILD